VRQLVGLRTAIRSSEEITNKRSNYPLENFPCQKT
jgi:hypothetical protein